MDGITPDQAEALRIARELIDAGVPIFAAPPCPSGPFGDDAFDSGARCSRPGHAAGTVEYDLPAKWQDTYPSAVWLDRWQPGWALAAVGGHVADFLDEDPRNGGDASVGELTHAGQWPTVFGQARTPSGGRHYLISPLGERKVTGLMPGLDYQGGAPDGKGRGFVWIAPTIKRSKDPSDGGAVRAYTWEERPDVTWLADFLREDGTSSDGSTDGLRLRLAAYRARRVEAARDSREGAGGAPRTFTPEQMRHFCAEPEGRLRSAKVGEIEEAANAFACTLSHFVPTMLTEDQAYDILVDALGETAYDPTHPASTWEAEKFHAVLAGERGRAPGDWYAVPMAETPDQAAAAVTSDDVDALIAEMIEPAELIKRRPPRHIVRGLLTFDSESWLIGPPGSKKSFVALDMAAHVACGLDWQGRRTEAARVVMVVAEGAGGVGKRMDAWQRRYQTIPEGQLMVLPRPVQAKDIGAWAVLIQACARLGAGMVVIDTQARVTVGLEENSATEMGVYVQAARGLRVATGACVLTVHHTGRRGGDARGSSAIDGAQDTELKIEASGKEFATLYTEKQKDIEPSEPIKLKFVSVDLGTDEDGEPINSLVLSRHDAWRVGEMDDQGLDLAALDAARDVSPFTVRAAVEPWTFHLAAPNAVLQRWIIQTLADVGYEIGLTEKNLRDLVATKVGRFETPRSRKMTIDSSTWTDAFQPVVADTAHPARGVVVQVGGEKRWTVDPVALAAFKEKIRN